MDSLILGWGIGIGGRAAGLGLNSLVGSLVLFAFYYDCSLTPSSFCFLSLHSLGLKGGSYVSAGGGIG